MALATDIFYGLCTFWTDDWEALRARTRGSTPCCPYCGAVGFEINGDEWWRQIHQHERNGHPGYAAMVEWGKGRCFPTYTALEAAWRATLS